MRKILGIFIFGYAFWINAIRFSRCSMLLGIQKNDFLHVRMQLGIRQLNDMLSKNKKNLILRNFYRI